MMTTRLKYLFFFLSFSLLMGCMKEIYMGQSTLTNNSRLWIPYQGGEKVVFLNVNSSEGATMSYELGKRKSIFNNITECRAKNPFQDECEVYSMEYEFVTATSVDKKGTLTYSLERGQKDKKFYDELKLRVQYYGSSEVNMVLQVYNDTGTLDKNCDFVAYPNTIKLGNKSFSDVYVKKVGSQEVYYTKKQGVVAFKVDGTNLWMKQ